MNCQALQQLKIIILITILFLSRFSNAQLIVTASPVKAEGNKAFIKLDFKNELTNSIESARASVFLLNGESVVGQGTRWVIGGTKDKLGLAPGETTSFFFVITSDKTLSESTLTAKVNFSRVVLEGGKLANPGNDVRIRTSD